MTSSIPLVPGYDGAISGVCIPPTCKIKYWIPIETVVFGEVEVLVIIQGYNGDTTRRYTVDGPGSFVIEDCLELDQCESHVLLVQSTNLLLPQFSVPTTPYDNITIF
jgi:hypothetical protein